MDIDQREPDAATIEHLEALGFNDPLRQDFPALRLSTRKGDLNQAMRYLDRIMMTTELSEHMETRVGIYQPAIFGLEDTDHRMVVADLPIDVAGVSEERAELWDIHKSKSLRWDCDDKGNMDSAKSEEFNSRVKQSKPTDTDATSIAEWLKASGRGTVLKEVTQEYPRRVRKLKDFQASDWKMRQNAKTMREILRCLEDGIGA